MLYLGAVSCKNFGGECSQAPVENPTWGKGQGKKLVVLWVGGGPRRLLPVEIEKGYAEPKEGPSRSTQQRGRMKE